MDMKSIIMRPYQLAENGGNEFRPQLDPASLLVLTQCPLLPYRDNPLRRNDSSACGAKRTLSQKLRDHAYDNSGDHAGSEA